jgi:isoquinoline 1-oxidoreductase beta subunit
VADYLLGMKGNNNWLAMEAEGGSMGDMYYAIPSLRSAVSRTPSPLVEGWWRAVNFSYNNVVIECFIDELAKKAGVDPVEYRLSLLKDMPARKIKDGTLFDPARLAAVVELAAEKIDWNKKRGAGKGVGIACCFYNHAKAYTAHAFEVSVSKTKKIKILRAVVATDVGMVIDPDGFANQVEGGFVWGLSAVLKSEITLANGAVQQSSFFDFQVARMQDVPALEIHVIPSNAEPGGAGETSVPSVIPGLMNAIAAATGVRVRELPLKNKGYTI